MIWVLTTEKVPAKQQPSLPYRSGGIITVCEVLIHFCFFKAIKGVSFPNANANAGLIFYCATVWLRVVNITVPLEYQTLSFNRS